MSLVTAMRIKKIREFRNFTQTHVANKLNISQNAYSKIENGTSKLSSDRLEEIARILDVPTESILSNEHQVFNLENNNIDKFFGYINNLHQENNELFKKTITILEQQSNLIKQQNEVLIKTLESFSKK